MKKFALIAVVIGVAGISWAASPTAATPEAGAHQPYRMHSMASGNGHPHGMKGENHADHKHGHSHAKMACDQPMPGHRERGHRHH